MSPAEIYVWITQQVFENQHLSANERLVILTLSYLRIVKKIVPTLALVQEQSGVDLSTINMPYIANEFKEIERAAFAR